MAHPPIAHHQYIEKSYKCSYGKAHEKEIAKLVVGRYNHILIELNNELNATSKSRPKERQKIKAEIRLITVLRNKLKYYYHVSSDFAEGEDDISVDMAD